MPPTVTDPNVPPANLANPAATEVDLQTDEVTIPVKLCNLPPFHGIASQVLALTADPDVDLGQLSTVIGSDPAFGADILFLANSSLFGFPSRMHVLRHAIALLGLERIKALAVTVAMRGFLGKPSPLVHQCWRHSVATAIICEEIAGFFDFSGDRAYTAGIMHDIGQLGLLKTYPKEMTPILNAPHRDVMDVLRAEREALNVDHTRAGSWLVNNWALPKDFSEICLHHHDAVSVKDSEILQLVKIGSRMADAIGFPAVRCKFEPTYGDATSPLLWRLERKSLLPEEVLRDKLTERLAAFSR